MILNSGLRFLLLELINGQTGAYIFLNKKNCNIDCDIHVIYLLIINIKVLSYLTETLENSSQRSYIFRMSLNSSDVIIAS